MGHNGILFAFFTFFSLVKDADSISHREFRPHILQIYKLQPDCYHNLSEISNIILYSISLGIATQYNGYNGTHPGVHCDTYNNHEITLF